MMLLWTNFSMTNRKITYITVVRGATFDRGELQTCCKLIWRVKFQFVGFITYKSAEIHEKDVVVFLFPCVRFASYTLHTLYWKILKTCCHIEYNFHPFHELIILFHTFLASKLNSTIICRSSDVRNVLEGTNQNLVELFYGDWNGTVPGTVEYKYF